MNFRLVFYRTRSDNKYDSESECRHEYFGDADAIWQLWFLLHKEHGWPHVEVYSCDGRRQSPENGLAGMGHYNL